MRIVHVVATGAFAGTERYVAEVCRRLAERGHEVLVLGGAGMRMQSSLGEAAWRPAAGLAQAAAGLARLRNRDIVHTHLTAAELAGLSTRLRHGGRVVSTRHIAEHRGSSAPVRLLSPLVDRALARQIAISNFVADRSGSPCDLVLHNGTESVPVSTIDRRPIVLVLQRLEPEKATAQALRAWSVCGLASHGWQLHIAGDGAERHALEQLSRDLRLTGVHFLGSVDDVSSHLGEASILLATATAEPLGLSVLEAMARGTSVVATASAGHLETLGSDYAGLYPSESDSAAAGLLQQLSQDPALARSWGEDLRHRQSALFDIEGHVDQLELLYVDALSS